MNRFERGVGKKDSDLELECGPLSRVDWWDKCKGKTDSKFLLCE